MFTYDRSAAGAKEKITIKNCNIEIAVNGEAKTVTELNFILNEYGDCTGDKATQYQCKIPVGKKLSAGDTVTVTFKNKNGDFSGEGESTAKIDTLTVSLIDNAEAANWYKELVADDLEYQPLFNKENSSNNGDPVTPPAGDEGNTGTGNEGTTPGSTIFDEEKEITWSKFLIIESNKFDGETPKTISIYYDCPKESEYVAMKIAANYENAALGDGTIEGGNFKTDDKGAIEAMGNPSDTGKVVSYKPTDNEWNIITKSGFYINGNGVKITKVTLK